MIMNIIIFLLGMKIIILLLGKWLRVWGSEYVGGFKSTGVLMLRWVYYFFLNGGFPFE
ncbi:hypothetical protein Hanom_Chr01g00047121 [Helianthus anomalus]